MKLRRRVFEVRYEKAKTVKSNTAYRRRAYGVHPMKMFSTVDVPARWVLKEGKTILGINKTKYALLKSARLYCNSEWGVYKNPVQLKICKKDGSYQTEHTYGNDPKRHKG